MSTDPFFDPQLHTPKSTFMDQFLDLMKMRPEMYSRVVNHHTITKYQLRKATKPFKVIFFSWVAFFLKHPVGL